MIDLVSEIKVKSAILQKKDVNLIRILIEVDGFYYEGLITRKRKSKINHQVRPGLKR